MIKKIRVFEQSIFILFSLSIINMPLFFLFNYILLNLVGLALVNMVFEVNN